jgi:hypothetical protein
MNSIREFKHAGRNFEISAGPERDAWKIRLLENGKQASPIVYSVSCETAIDATTSDVPVNLVEELIQLLKHDVKTGILPLTSK